MLFFMETLVGSQEDFVGRGAVKAVFGMFLYSFQLVNYKFHMSDTFLCLIYNDCWSQKIK